jgi:hypothetical protein
MSVTKTAKSVYMKRQCCAKCGWFEKPPRSPFPLLRECCPVCGNNEIKRVIGRYTVETTRQGIWPFVCLEKRYTEFEKAT